MCEKENWKDKILKLYPAKDAPLLDVPSTHVRKGEEGNWWEEPLEKAIDESC